MHSLANHCQKSIKLAPTHDSYQLNSVPQSERIKNHHKFENPMSAIMSKGSRRFEISRLQKRHTRQAQTAQGSMEMSSTAVSPCAKRLQQINAPCIEECRTSHVHTPQSEQGHFRLPSLFENPHVRDSVTHRRPIQRPIQPSPKRRCPVQ